MTRPSTPIAAIEHTSECGHLRIFTPEGATVTFPRPFECAACKAVKAAEEKTVERIVEYLRRGDLRGNDPIEAGYVADAIEEGAWRNWRLR